MNMWLEFIHDLAELVHCKTDNREDTLFLQALTMNLHVLYLHWISVLVMQNRWRTENPSVSNNKNTNDC